MAFNEKTDFTTISIRDYTIKTLLKQSRTELKCWLPPGALKPRKDSSCST